MIIAYTRYRIPELRRAVFLAAYRDGAQFLVARCENHELTNCTDEPELFTLRIGWASHEDEARFHEEPAGAGFANALRDFEDAIEERRHWELAPSFAEPQLWRDLHAWVQANLHQHITVEKMAERVNMSLRNFSRVFRRRYRLTPGEYVERARVAAATSELANRAHSIKEVAAAKGFGSAITMRRAFRRVLGMAPSEFRGQSRVS
jgi:AraC-like DNA-binding protein